MPKSFQVMLRVIPVFVAVSVLALADGQEKATHDGSTAKIELLLGEGKAKVISVALGQSAREVFNLCKPAKVYADDDPWLGCMAAGGGHYVLFFQAEGTAKEMKGRLDPGRDKLYAVVRYPTKSRDDGEFLLPKTKQGKIYGDFVTLKVPLGPDKARVATVAAGMSPRDVMRLFRPAPDRADEDHAILYDSLDAGRYLLIFSPRDDSHTHDPKLDKLSEVLYRPGGETEAIFLLPRRKRGKPVPAEYRTLLENSGSVDETIRHGTVEGIIRADQTTGHVQNPRARKLPNRCSGRCCRVKKRAFNGMRA